MDSAKGIWDADLTEGVLSIEPGLDSLLGARPLADKQDVDTLRLLVHPDDLTGLEHAIRDVVAGKATVICIEFRLKHSDGRWIWIEAQGRLGSKKKRLSGTWVDVTERVEGLARKNQAVARVNQFAAAASHDLIGPLRHIAMYGDLLVGELATSANDEQRQMLQALSDKARHLQILTKRLISFSTGTAAPEFKAVVLQEALGHVKALLSDAITEQGAVLTWDDLPVVVGDPVLIEKVFENLIDNALEWSGDRGVEISISAITAGQQVMVQVSDNGRGIDPKYAGRIFDAFWSMPKKNGEKGAGLGLAVCKTILHALDGDITLKKSGPDGSTFEITLPRNR